MSLEAHHQFIINTMMRQGDIARKFIQELEAENVRLKTDYAALLAATQWRPIETAPMDGSEVLTYNDISGIHQASWSRGNRYGHWDTERWLDRETNWVVNPTHWMPLPKPPIA